MVKPSFLDYKVFIICAIASPRNPSHNNSVPTTPSNPSKASPMSDEAITSLVFGVTKFLLALLTLLKGRRHYHKLSR